MPVELAPFYVSLLDRDKVLKDRTHALQEATVAALSSCRETRQHLFEVGVLRSAASSEVEAQVREIFARFRTCPDPGQMAYEENGRLVRPEEVVGVIRLLVQLETENPTPEGPTLHPRVDFSIYDDWKVDRSMLHFEPLQGVLQRKYRYGGQMMNHLVIGPGDCSAARELSAHPSSGLWNYPAVGDILFYLIEKVMAQFIRADKRDDEAVRQCVDIISRRLRSHLRREWYQGAGNARRQLRKVKRTDLNEIFPFLADPTWLEQDVKDQKVKASQEFDEDSWELLPDRVYELILGYLGWPEEKVREHMLQVQLAGLKERSWEVRHSFHSITYVKNRVAEYTTPALQDQWLLELCEIMDDYSLLEEPRDLLTRVKECMVRIRARRREIGGSYEAERHGLSQGAERERRRGLEALQAEEGILRERFQRVKLHFDGIPPEARRQYHVAFREESSGLRGRAAAEELRAADRLQAADDVLKSVHLVGQEKERDRLTEKLRRLKDFENKVSTARNEVGDSDKVWSDAAGELAQLVGAKKLNTPHRSTVVMQHIDGMLEQRKAAQLAIERKIASVQQALQDLQKTKTQPDGVAVDGGERSPGDAPGDSDSHPHLKGLGELFSPYFLKGVKWASHYAGGKYDRMGNYPNTDTPVIDLHALVPLEVGAHFIPGDFLMIPGLIPDDSVHLATADKSDTHLRAWPFEQHIRNLLSKLAPGGYICTMGLVGSYDRLPRVFEMRRLEEVFSPEYLFEVELNPESREITRIHIQRSHHKGFLNDAEKSEAFGDTAKFDTLGRITARPDVFVLNHVIRRIDRLAEEDQDVFNQLNDHLRDMLRRLALDLGMQKVRSWYPGIADGDIAETMAAGDVHFDLETWIVRQIQTPVTEEGTLFERMDFDELIRLLEETLYEQAERLGLDVAEDRRFGGRRVRGSSGRIVVPGRLETFQSEQLNTVPRIDLPVSRWNRFCHLDPRNKLPGNEELLTGEARERLQEKIQELRIKLVKLRRQLGGKEPLTLVDFADCVTNDLLREKLKYLLGDDVFQNMVRLIRIDFREGGEFTHQDQVMAQVREALQFGGIFVSGGSWFNSFDSHGRFLREQISRPACEASLTFDSQVRRLDLCFSYQTDADELAPFLGLDGLQTSPGALEFGPSSLRVMEMGHPLFRDLPRRLSVAQTHASHVLFPPGLFGGESRLRILCTSGLTGLPIGYDVRGPHKRKGNPDIRILALQCHPEIGVDRRGQLDWERVMKEVRAKREGLVPAFGADVISLIDQNIRLGHQVIRADAGPELLMNGLICLVDSLLN